MKDLNRIVKKLTDPRCLPAAIPHLPPEIEAKARKDLYRRR